MMTLLGPLWSGIEFFDFTGLIPRLLFVQKKILTAIASELSYVEESINKTKEHYHCVICHNYIPEFQHICVR